MAAGDFCRMESHRIVVNKLLQTNPSLPCVLVNVRQNAEFMGTVTTNATPALLTRSLLFDAVRNRVVLAAQHWLIQGFAHPLLTSPLSTCGFPFPVQALMPQAGGVSGAEQRRLTGNSMHKVAVSCWLLYCWLAADKSSLMPS